LDSKESRKDNEILGKEEFVTYLAQKKINQNKKPGTETVDKQQMMGLITRSETQT
jgi:hypothetical protein